MTDVEVVVVGILIMAALGIAFLLLIAFGTRKRVTEVHDIVNSQRTAMMVRLDQLTAALTKSGIAVPPAPPPIPSEKDG